VDLDPLANSFLVNHTIDTIRRLGGNFGLCCGGLVPVRDRKWFRHDLCKHYGIDYRAPADARCTGLPDGSVDLITSTDTFEHIPRSDLCQVVRECFRILRPGAIASFRIDYGDHYAYSDPNITPYNFLQYTNRQWSRFCSALQYQNRLRHSDYLRLLAEAGFEVIQTRCRGGGRDDIRLLQRVPIAGCFKHYSPGDLAILGSQLVMRKPVLA
jgi:hypothetical protein